jgi:hypothetical protein
MRAIREMKVFWKWLAAGQGVNFMGRPVKDMTREELLAVIGCLVMREKSQRATEERRQHGVLKLLRERLA